MLNIVKKICIAGQTLHVYGSEEEPLFQALEVARCIDNVKLRGKYYDTTRMLNPVKGKQKHLTFQSKRLREMWFLTIEGLYQVLTNSNKPVAIEMAIAVQQLFDYPLVDLSSPQNPPGQTLHPFTHPEFGQVRTIEKEGEPWFVGKDAAIALGYSNPQKATRDHVDTEDKGVNTRNDHHQRIRLVLLALLLKAPISERVQTVGDQ